MISFPNAKINLGLNILRRRADGYHDLDTVFYPVPLCDALEIVPTQAPATTLHCTGRTVDCPMEKNLVMKAYRLLEQEFQLPPVEMHLVKNIPDGAGLGGGSSDAAHALLMLNDIFQLCLSKPDLAQRAATLGADCAFFIYNTPMSASGIGDVLQPCNVSLQGYQLLLVKPPVSVPTKAAYAKVTPAESDTTVAQILATTPVEDWAKAGVKNDFEPSVFAQYPEIRQLKEAIEQSGAAYTAMSGSGSSVFGIYPPAAQAAAENAHATLSQRYPDTFLLTL